MKKFITVRSEERRSVRSAYLRRRSASRYSCPLSRSMLTNAPSTFLLADELLRELEHRDRAAEMAGR